MDYWPFLVLLCLVGSLPFLGAGPARSHWRCKAICSLFLASATLDLIWIQFVVSLLPLCAYGAPVGLGYALWVTRRGSEYSECSTCKQVATVALVITRMIHCPWITLAWLECSMWKLTSLAARSDNDNNRINKRDLFWIMTIVIVLREDCRSMYLDAGPWFCCRRGGFNKLRGKTVRFNAFGILVTMLFFAFLLLQTALLATVRPTIESTLFVSCGVLGLGAAWICVFGEFLVYSDVYSSMVRTALMRYACFRDLELKLPIDLTGLVVSYVGARHSQ